MLYVLGVFQLFVRFRHGVGPSMAAFPGRGAARKRCAADPGSSQTQNP